MNSDLIILIFSMITGVAVITVVGTVFTVSIYFIARKIMLWLRHKK